MILANKHLIKDMASSATSEFDQFIDQPIAGANNTGSLSITSSGNYFGSTEINIKIVITTAGNVGVAKFRFSDDGGNTFFGFNDEPVFEDFEVITGAI